MRQYDFTTEWPKILAQAATVGVDPYAVATIRAIENGAPGREFGVLSESALDYTAQLRIACRSLHNRLLEYGGVWFDYNGRLCLTRSFVKYFASKWAPTGAANDPTNLNANWPENFWKVYLAFVDEGGPIVWQTKQGAAS